MLNEKRSKFAMVLIVIFALFSFSIETNNKCTDESDFLSHKVRIDLYCGYKKEITNYDEGKFIDYYYKDGSSITIYKGALNRLPLLHKESGYLPERIDTIDNRVMTFGTKDGKCWREDDFNGIRVVYNGVHPENKEGYDSIIESVVIAPIR